jgi:hypothetical protein
MMKRTKPELQWLWEDFLGTAVCLGGTVAILWSLWEWLSTLSWILGVG